MRMRGERREGGRFRDAPPDEAPDIP